MLFLSNQLILSLLCIVIVVQFVNFSESAHAIEIKLKEN